MRFALPQFHFRFASNAGHTILPLNFHPRGCLQYAEKMVDRLLELQPTVSLPKSAGNWLIIGGSGGFGWAARAVLATCFAAKTLSISLDASPQPQNKSTSRQLGSPGFYRDLGLTRRLHQIGRTAQTIHADVFLPQTCELAIRNIHQFLDGKIDGLVWALATPRGFDPRTERYVSTAIKPYPQEATIKTFTHDSQNEAIRIVEPLLMPGTPEEAIQTQYVMGGQLVGRWMEELMRAGVLSPGFTLLTLSYRGSALTEAIYRHGLIGLAKADLEFQTKALDYYLKKQLDGRALVVEAPAVVTEASGGIPGVPLYLALLMEAMGQRFEDPLAAMLRLFTEQYSPIDPSRFICDEEGLLRLDDRELAPEVVQKMSLYFDRYHEGDELEPHIYHNFMNKYQQLRGFSLPGIDYTQAVDLTEIL